MIKILHPSYYCNRNTIIKNIIQVIIKINIIITINLTLTYRFCSYFSFWFFNSRFHFIYLLLLLDLLRTIYWVRMIANSKDLILDFDSIIFLWGFGLHVHAKVVKLVNIHLLLNSSNSTLAILRFFSSPGKNELEEHSSSICEIVQEIVWKTDCIWM